MKVSIIITSYNYGRYIERCVRSCLDQKFPKEDFEVIVVDDCSTDETSQVMQAFEGVPNLRYIVNKQNLGVAGSANVGIRAARGQFVVRVDADDYISSKLIAYLSDYLYANHDAFCVSCDYVYVDERESKEERVYAEEKPVSCGIMYRKDLLVEYGLYNAEWRHREEEELRKRLGKLYKIHHLRFPLYRYRMHKSNKTKQLDMMEEFRQKLEHVADVDHARINVEKETTDARAVDAYAVAVIPARGGSQRLKKKNIFPVKGKPMLAWAIEAARESRYIKDVFVSSEDEEILRVAQEHGAKVIRRRIKLAEGKVYKQDVICHAAGVIEQEAGKPTLVVSLQANSPQVRGKHIDQGIDHLKRHGKQEVMSVDKDLNQNAAIRIMTYDATFQKTLSTNFGVFVADLLDVHTEEDVRAVEAAWNRA